MGRLACLLLALARGTAPSCAPSGSTTLASFVGSGLRYGFETLFRGGLIGLNSDACALSFTPTPETFSIWSFIYPQSAIFYVPGVATDAELHHLQAVNERTSDWLQTFADARLNNTRAYALLRDTSCHLDAVESLLCARTAYACCVAAQWAAWVRVATRLSGAIAAKYGDECGGAVATDDARYEREFVVELDALLAAADSLRGVQRTMALSVYAWAFRGVCDARNGRCLELADTRVAATVRDLSRQSPPTLLASMACVAQ